MSVNCRYCIQNIVFNLWHLRLWQSHGFL